MSVPAAQTPPRSTTPTQNAAAASSDTVKLERRPSGARLPSLNQLAARINISAPSPTSGPSSASAAARPRLAASLLRTGSTTSLTTTTSAGDSVAVQAPSSRSSSPATGMGSPPTTSTPTAEGAGGEPLTTEKLAKLEEQTSQAPGDPVQFPSQETPIEGPGQDAQLPKQKMPKGYKNIPSLDAITERLRKARHLSIDGTAQLPPAQTIEDPKTPGLMIKAPEHPLENAWTIYHDQKAPYTPATATVEATPIPTSATAATHPMAPEQHDYEAGLSVIGEDINTVELFCRYFNWLKPPSKLERNSNYHLFKTGIKPMWEDEANAQGGKWVLTMKNNPQLLDRCWSWLAMALVGEELDDGDEICGAVVSLRSKVDRIQVWTRSKDDVEKLNGIAKKLVKILDVSEADHIGLEFQYNSDDRPSHNKFLSIQSIPQTSYRSTFRNSPMSGPGEGPPSAGPGGAFGSFGVGAMGGAGRGWKRP